VAAPAATPRVVRSGSRVPQSAATAENAAAAPSSFQVIHASSGAEASDPPTGPSKLTLSFGTTRPRDHLEYGASDLSGRRRGETRDGYSARRCLLVARRFPRVHHMPGT
jgi:hypothetical protein